MTRRTGASLRETINTASTATMLTLGLGENQAARIIRTRRVLPLVEDPKAPRIDARKLWAQIGKPHGRFNAWAAHYLKPLGERPVPFAEISVKATTGTGGRPRQDYTLSRALAADLAMQANTPEGEDIRAYFLDMERLALRLAEHLGIRVDAIVGTDNMVTSMLIKRAAEQARDGTLKGESVKAVALDRGRLLKAIVCEVLTGHSTAHWRDTFGKGVRDVLDTGDALLYSQCYESARAAIAGGIAQRARLESFLHASYGAKVSPAKYAHKAKQQA
jgi:phage anti-repressor protein